LRTIGAKLRPGRPKLEPPAKLTLPFYRTPEWHALMSGIRRMRGNACQDPEHDPRTPRHGHRTYGDHIVELKDGGDPLDPRNILLRCPSCHQKKTNRERLARYQARLVP